MCLLFQILTLLIEILVPPLHLSQNLRLFAQTATKERKKNSWTNFIISPRKNYKLTLVGFFRRNWKTKKNFLKQESFSLITKKKKRKEGFNLIILKLLTMIKFNP